MPLYEYQCRQCQARFEKLILNGSTKIACSRCDSTEVTELPSTFAVSSDSRASGTMEPGPCGACGAPERGSCGMSPDGS